MDQQSQTFREVTGVCSERVVVAKSSVSLRFTPRLGIILRKSCLHLRIESLITTNNLPQDSKMVLETIYIVRHGVRYFPACLELL